MEQSELDKRNRIERGKEAEKLLNHPLIKEFLSSAERAIIQQWSNSDVHDIEGQRTCRIALRCQENLKSQFNKCIASGKQAAAKPLTNTKTSKLRGLGIGS